MIVRFLLWLTARLPVLEFAPGGNARYFLGGAFGYGAYIHHFRQADLGSHNHPWERSVSLVLSGFCIERRKDHIGAPERVRVLRAGDINLIPGACFHQLQIPEGVEMWTLFFHGRAPNVWGWLKDFAGVLMWTPAPVQGGEDGIGTDWAKQPKGWEIRGGSLARKVAAQFAAMPRGAGRMAALAHIFGSNHLRADVLIHKWVAVAKGERRPSAESRRLLSDLYASIHDHAAAERYANASVVMEASITDQADHPFKVEATFGPALGAAAAAAVIAVGGGAGGGGVGHWLDPTKYILGPFSAPSRAFQASMSGIDADLHRHD